MPERQTPSSIAKGRPCILGYSLREAFPKRSAPDASSRRVIEPKGMRQTTAGKQKSEVHDASFRLRFLAFRYNFTPPRGHGATRKFLAESSSWSSASVLECKCGKTHVTPVISLRSPSLCFVTNYYYAE